MPMPAQSPYVQLSPWDIVSPGHDHRHIVEPCRRLHVRQVGGNLGRLDEVDQVLVGAQAAAR